MGIARWTITNLCKVGLEVMCQIDKADLHKIPERGPLLTYTNHTGMVEAPLIYTQLLPRPVTALAKAETWDNWFLGWVFSLWEIIPVRRGEADMEAIRKSLAALDNGKILGISPEGTRSRTGKLLRAHPGIVVLALKSDAPLVPMAHWGGEKFSSNVKRLKRTPFNIRIGEPFRLDTKGQKMTKDIRQQMADEMMYKLAALLPEEYRGEYSDLENATEEYLVPA